MPAGGPSSITTTCYDARTNNLTWSVRVHGDNGEGVNHSVRLLDETFRDVAAPYLRRIEFPAAAGELSEYASAVDACSECEGVALKLFA